MPGQWVHRRSFPVLIEEYSPPFFFPRFSQELTYVIKQDLSRLNAQILALQQHVRATTAKGNRSTRQMDEHSGNVVIILQSKLANTSMGFKEALEIRSEVMNVHRKGPSSSETMRKLGIES